MSLLPTLGAMSDTLPEFKMCFGYKCVLRVQHSLFSFVTEYMFRILIAIMLHDAK